jgi:hypothetical protein
MGNATNDFKFKKTMYPKIWDVIERISTTLDLKDSELADLLLLTRRELLKHRESKKDLPMNKLFNLSERLNVGFDLIVTGKIDYQAMAHHFFGDNEYLPEKYSNCKLGRRSSSIMILDFIENNFGWKERQSILRHFQLNEAIFANPNDPISFSFNTELIDYIVKYKIDKSYLPLIGTQSFLKYNPAAVKKELVGCADVGEIYERFCDHIIGKYFEKNFQYKIEKMNKDGCIVIATPNRELIENLKTDTPGTSLTSLYRLGIASIYPSIIGLPQATAKQTASIYDGDPYIRYEINYEKAQTIHTRRIKEFGNFEQIPFN